MSSCIYVIFVLLVRALTGTADGEFCMIPNVLMLAAGIMNARRTDDLCNMTLTEFSNAVSRELVRRIE